MGDAKDDLATVFTVWATVKTVALTVKRPFGHEKSPHEGALHTLLSKDTTKKAEMQVAFFGLILHKSVGREDEFSKSKGGAAH